MEGVSICSVTPEMQATLHTFMFQNQIKFASFVRVCKQKQKQTSFVADKDVLEGVLPTLPIPLASC